MFQKVFEELEQFGLLLLSDKALPSVAGLVAGEPIRGSWWAHPKGHAIFRVNVQLADHPDVIITKLVSGKVTWVHRKLWPALVSVATSRGQWQMQHLSPASRPLLSVVTRKGLLHTDQVQTPTEAARELENRLLVYSEEIHTERGSHAKCLESWDHWANRVGFTRQRMPIQQAKHQLEGVIARLNARYGGKGRLPWIEK